MWRKICVSESHVSVTCMSEPVKQQRKVSFISLLKSRKQKSLTDSAEIWITVVSLCGHMLLQPVSSVLKIVFVINAPTDLRD